MLPLEHYKKEQLLFLDRINMENYKYENESALAGVAQWIERWPMNQRVAGLIPSPGTCLGCGPSPQEGVNKRQPHIDVSLPLFLPPFPSLKK